MRILTFSIEVCRVNKYSFGCFPSARKESRNKYSGYFMMCLVYRLLIISILYDYSVLESDKLTLYSNLALIIQLFPFVHEWVVQMFFQKHQEILQCLRVWSSLIHPVPRPYLSIQLSKHLRCLLHLKNDIWYIDLCFINDLTANNWNWWSTDGPAFFQ